jgi:restriction system protein
LNKVQKQSLSNVLGTVTFIIVIMYQHQIEKILPFLDNIYLFIAFTLFCGFLVAKLIFHLLPSSNNKKMSKTNKTNKKKTTSPSRIPHNRILSDAEILQLDLKDISATELERLCYLYYQSKGYKPELTKKGADGGIDLTYYQPGIGKTAVQIKHYINSNNQITVKEIRELNSAKRNYDCVFSEFITTSRFTPQAAAEAPKSMNLHNIHWFNSKVIPWMKKESYKNQKSS